MNLILLYTFCIVAIILNYLVGIILKNSALKQFAKTEGLPAECKITGSKLILYLSEQVDLKNLQVVKLKAKKTNYFSFKYNVIKLSPITFNSYELSQLSIASHCFMQAKTCQKHTILYIFKLFFVFISKCISALFLPSFLICAIINTQLSQTINFYLLVAFVICFIIQSLDYLINLNSQKYLLKDLNSANLFTEKEIEIIKKQIVSINKIVFYDYSRYTIFFLQFTSPDILIQLNSNNPIE